MVLALGALLAALAVGVAATLAFAWAAVGHLNAMSAFLTAIVIGNGINPGLVLLARYSEELRRGIPADSAVAAAIAGAWRGTLAATLTAAIAYAALVVTDFRGFRHFGLIGGVGMLACWVSAFSVMPAALLVLARLGWVRPRRQARLGVWVGKLAPKRPRHVLASGMVIVGVAVAITSAYLASDPFANDWRDLQSDSADLEAQRRVDARMAARFEQRMLGGQSYRLVFAVPSREVVAPLVNALQAAKDREGAPLFREVHWFDELVPGDQAVKLEVLAEIRALLDDSTIGQLPADEQEALHRLRPPDDLAPVVEAAIPEELAWPFLEQDGTAGRLVFAWGATRFQTWDVGDRVEFADAVRRILLPAGTAIGGEALVIAEIVASMKRDAPWMIGASLVGSILAVWLVVGLRRHGAVTLISGGAGVVLMIAACALVGIRVHFLDLIALPITIGIGVDYAVNLAARHRAERSPDARHLLETTGAAVVLCSYTTTVGYGSLLLSSNGGIRAFGLAALIGEIACVMMALVLVPALLAVWSGAAGRAAGPARRT
jgi:uncharacterized protein